MNEFEKTDRHAITKVSQIVDVFRAVSPEIPAQMIMTFLIVCKSEGCSVNDVATRLGMPKSSASRNVSAISPVHRKGMAGLGLVDSDYDPMDRRAKKISLTAKGRRLRAQLVEILSQ